ncbi:fibrous sheath CABYR-binding protein isoform X2 [Notothenia coriiceps]|uniref:Fibrous sheath CABYR-binding protein isoform X2 n=1 Tax=Notothenia coriiceps TaxID=8208 RepID=A0A6I9PTW5_9TELE|nr:PREDICTED: NADH dehydrogenase [ubiquinone] flavoprotein 3, mitochondrial isoform X2 [Notothenia coriiceps]
MATYLLRLGRLGSLKCLHQESWCILRSRPAALFCSRAEGPPQSAERPPQSAERGEAAGKTEVQDERATLLAYKTAVTFPVRLSEPGVFLTQGVGATESVASPIAAAETAVAAAQVIINTAASTTDDADAVATAFSEPLDPAADGSSSSSSSSDSDSDSDSEDKNLEKAETKTSLPEVSYSSVQQRAEVQEVASDVKGGTNEVKKEVPPEPEATPACSAAAAEAAQAPATIEAPSVSSEELVDPAPEICTATGDTMTSPEVSAKVEPAPELIKNDQVQTSAEVVIEASTSEKAQTDVRVYATEPPPAEYPAEAAEALVKATEADPVEAAAESVETEVAPTEVAAEAVAEVSALVKSTKDLVDPAPAIAQAAPAEAGVESSAPEELVDPAPVLAQASPAEAAVEDTEPVQGTEELVDPAAVVAEAAPAGDAAGPVEAEAAPTEVAAEAAAGGSVPEESPEDLVDTAPVIAEAAGEELQAEGPVEASEEAAAPPEPNEPFDNSTYKNIQHHNYTPFTFADLDVEMAKFRLPQPSSIRH